MIIELLILLYVSDVLLNIYLISKCNLFDFKVDVMFSIVYIFLSPLTVFYSVGKAMETWYQFMKNKKLIIDTLKMELIDTKYASLSDKDLYEITGVLAEHLEYAELDSFEAIFTILEEEQFIICDEDGNYHFNYQTGQEE